MLALNKRPEFTTLMKAKPRIIIHSDDPLQINQYGGSEFSNHRAYAAHHMHEKVPTNRTEVIIARRDRDSNNLTYESILHNQIVGVKTLLIRAQAANMAHDPLAVMSYVEERANETVYEELAKIISQLESIQGPNPTHR